MIALVMQWSAIAFAAGFMVGSFFTWVAWAAYHRDYRADHHG